MTRRLLPIAALVLGLCAGSAPAQQGPRATARAGQDRAAHDKAGPDKRGAPQVIGCPSLANYRMLMHGGAPAASTVLADPKADHLGCTTLGRGEVTGIADRVTLGGQSYDCAGVRGTTACHWMEAGAAARLAPAGR